MPFKSTLVIYIMPIVLCLKTSIAAVTSYIYISRFVSEKKWAFLGSMLYAFSGFQLLNTVFNNFHDITAIFPLVLVALDDLVYKDKKFFFAFVVAILAMTNYFFFFEIVVFLIIYFLIKLFTKQYLINLKMFSRIAFELILGVCLSAFIFIPSVLEVLSNSRINDL